MNERNREILLLLHNHFDPIWRRCWDRAFEYKGKTYRSYADLEDCIIKDWLASVEETGVVISEGQAVVWRKFLERNPDRLEQVLRLQKAGQLELTIGGEVVPDTNMPCGESLVRNYLYGLLWYEEVFGPDSWIPVATLEDAFGSSAQLPAILKGMEVEWVIDLSYRFVPGDYWRGLDGSVICIKRDFEQKWVWNNYKHPPCPSCNGAGCDGCNKTGFELGVRVSVEEIVEKIGECEFEQSGWCLVKVGGEEYMPCREMKTVLAQVEEKHPDCVVRPAGFREIYNRFRAFIDKTESATGLSDEVEGNPVFTGCLVTRIRLKQRFRELEHRLLAAEKLCALNYSMGNPYPAKELMSLWRILLFTAFHDAITGTHIDAAYRELMDMFDEVEAGAATLIEHGLGELGAHIDGDSSESAVLLFNPMNWVRTDPVEVVVPMADGVDIDRIGLRSPGGEVVSVIERQPLGDGKKARLTILAPAVPSLGYRVLHGTDSDKATDPVVEHDAIENEHFRIEIDGKGIRRIIDKATELSVLGDREWYVNELIMEEDAGNPWQTTKSPAFRRGLAGWTTSARVEVAGGLPKVVIEGRYEGPDRGVRHLRWRQETWLVPGRREIEFRTTIDWDTAHRRIRVAFPTLASVDGATYEVPYGALERERYEGENTRLTAGDGDWPAVRWAAVYDSEHDYTVALLNRGTPCYRVEEGVLLLTVLRSPADAWVLNEPEFYDCPDFDGARDTGSHEFRYRILAGKGTWRDIDAVRRSWEFNSPILSAVVPGGAGELPVGGCSLLNLDGSSIVVSTLKKSERDESVILRAYETSGQETSGALEAPGFKNQIVESNMLENGEGISVDSSSLGFGGFEIKTLRLMPSPEKRRGTEGVPRSPESIR